VLATSLCVVSAEVGSPEATGSARTGAESSVDESAFSSRVLRFFTTGGESVSLEPVTAPCTASDGCGEMSASSTISADFELSTSSGLTARLDFCGVAA